MKDDPIPNECHIVRYVKPIGIDADGVINGSEFRLRAHRPDDTGLSINWLECFRASSKNDQLAAVRRLFRLTVKSNGRFAELNVGRIRMHLAEELPSLSIVEDPLDATEKFEADPSHSLILGLPAGATPEAELVGDMIAECVIKLHSAIGGAEMDAKPP